MKKIFILLVLAISIACTKTKVNSVDVTFICNPGLTTKSYVDDIFTAGTPSQTDINKMQLQLTNKETGEVVTARVGSSITLKIGTYSVVSSIYLASSKLERNGNEFTSTFSYDITTDVEVHSYSTMIPLQATYRSAMLIFPKDCVQNVQCDMGSGSLSDIPQLIETNSAKGVFVSSTCVGSVDVMNIKVIANAQSDYKTTTYCVTTNLDKGDTYNGTPIHKLVPGKFYIVTPNSITETTKPLGVEFGDFEEGTL